MERAVFTIVRAEICTNKLYIFLNSVPSTLREVPYSLNIDSLAKPNDILNSFYQRYQAKLVKTEGSDNFWGSCDKYRVIPWGSCDNYRVIPYKFGQI